MLTLGYMDQVQIPPCRTKCKMPAKVPALWLSRQVSNLNSSDPESDVLPITLRDNFRGANIEIFLKKFKKHRKFC